MRWISYELGQMCVWRRRKAETFQRTILWLYYERERKKRKGRTIDHLVSNFSDQMERVKRVCGFYRLKCGSLGNILLSSCISSPSPPNHQSPPPSAFYYCFLPLCPFSHSPRVLPHSSQHLHVWGWASMIWPPSISKQNYCNELPQYFENSGMPLSPFGPPCPASLVFLPSHASQNPSGNTPKIPSLILFIYLSLFYYFRH